MPKLQASIPLRRWLGWTSVGIITIYLLLTGGTWWFVKYHRGVGSITYGDIALPSNWGRYQIKRGNHLIILAEQLLQTNQGNRGFQLLRMGLARSPANRDGRILLAQLFARNHRADLARETLQAGLTYHLNNHEYLAITLQFFIEQQDDSTALDLCDRLLKTPSTSTDNIELAALSAATVHHHQGDYDFAESLLIKYRIDKTREGRLLQTKIEWDRGYRELALILLRGLQHDFPSSEHIYSRLQEGLRSENRNAESRRLAILHQIKHPDRPGSYLDRIRLLEIEGDKDGAIQTAQNMIMAFAETPSPLLALGDLAATTGNVPIARALNIHFQKNNLPDSGIIKLLLIESLLNADQYQEALQETAQLGQARDTPIIDQAASTAKGLAAIAHYGLGDPGAGHAQLTAFMAQPQLRPASLFAIADRLAAIGYRSTAQDILAQALQLSPRSQPILTKLLELSIEDRNITALPEHLRALLTMRKPSPKILTDALNLLQSDQFLFLTARASLISDLEANLSKH